MHILGTAGHVDHGKSSLVRALTGTDPDRWIEEKLRGMTLDLGFAHLRFADGVEAGIVDVPGHERFLHNMLAGAAGMDLLLLVVAANEGPRPQTIEHLAILSYLNVRRTVVVLSKSDLVDAAGLESVSASLRDVVRRTVAEGAPVVAVSTVTGDGMDDLRRLIHEALRELPGRAADAPAYLPVDRVFALAGHGTIVTGTLMQGAIELGDSLMLTPLGRSVRVRSLQTFGESREAVAGGARVAVNLVGVERSEVRRGAVLASSQFEARRVFDVRFRPYAPSLGMLRRRMPVRVYVGAAEMLGTLVFGVVPVSAEAVGARLLLREDVVGLPGGAFVVRRLSPKDLLGGGTFAAGVREGPGDGGEDPVHVALLAALCDAGLAGASADRIGAAGNVRGDVAARVLGELVEAGRAFRVGRPEGFIEAGLLDAFAERVVAALEQYETGAPWTTGMTLLALSRELGLLEAELQRLLVVLADDGRIVARSGYYARVGFEPRLSDEQRAFFERQVPADPKQPFLPASLGEVVAAMRAARIAGLSAALDTLVVSGALVKVGESVYRGWQIAEVRRRLEEALRRDGSITASAFRDVVGTSRKYAVPLLEWFDATGVTVRSGDVRVLRERLQSKA